MTFVIFGHVVLFPLADSWLKKQRLFGGELGRFWNEIDGTESLLVFETCAS